jgi:hypothetical protein
MLGFFAKETYYRRKETYYWRPRDLILILEAKET